MTAPTPSAAPSDRAAPRDDSAYAWYVAGLLALAYAVAFIDRQVLNLLVDPIKGSLQLSDTQVSLLQGLAFVGAYVAMGPVFGRLGDLGNRRNLLIVGVVLWCASTILCGFANDFWSLFAARAGVGGAEAVLLPACWSLLSDYFSRERLPRAMSIFLLGPFVGGGLALIFGGLIVRAVTGVQFDGPLADLAPWQLTFVFVGAPGLVIALLLLTVREPPRRSLTAQADRSFSLGEVVAFLWRERDFYGRFFGGMGLLVVTLYALPAWTPTFLMREYSAARADVGIEYGTATLIAGTAGVLLGPWVARKLSARYPHDALVRTAVVAALGAAPACLLMPFAPNYWSALLLSAAASFFMNFALPTAASALQASTPNRMRGVVSSAYAFVLTTVGLGLAPTLIAMVNDAVLRDPGAIGTSLGAVCGIAATICIPLVVGAARRYAARLESATRG